MWRLYPSNLESSAAVIDTARALQAAYAGHADRPTPTQARLRCGLDGRVARTLTSISPNSRSNFPSELIFDESGIHRYVSQFAR